MRADVPPGPPLDLWGFVLAFVVLGRGSRAMTGNALAFYVAAFLVVGAALAFVLVPTPRLTLLAAVAVTLASALLLGVSGAYLLALAQLAVPGVTALWLLWLGRRHVRQSLLSMGEWRRSHGWAVGGVVAGAAAAVVIIVVVAGRAQWFDTQYAGVRLLTVLHYREPLALLAALGVALLAVLATVMLMAETADEKAHDAAINERHRKQQAIERRRADREAARQRRGQA